MKKLKVIDLFSGVGGLTYGFYHRDDFEIVAANEILPAMAKAYSLNHPDIKMYLGDVKDFSANRVRKDLGSVANEIDIIIGGPPCQAYSTVGKRRSEDPRAKLFLEYARLLEEFKPKLFIFENVKGLLSMRGGDLFKSIVSLFESLGYSVSYEVLNAADYGAPQIRERVVIVGSRLSNKFHYPAATHYNPLAKPSLLAPGLKRYVTLGEALGDLPLINSGEESLVYVGAPKNDFQKWARSDAPIGLMDHNAPKNGSHLIRLMEALPEGGSPRDLPIGLRPGSGFGNSYSRLWWDRPSTTITRNLGTPSSARCIHPKVARPLTAREGARLQCFPDSYQFYGSSGDRKLQIGNAVPIVLSVALAQSVSDLFKAEPSDREASAQVVGTATK